MRMIPRVTLLKKLQILQTKMTVRILKLHLVRLPKHSRRILLYLRPYPSVLEELWRSVLEFVPDPVLECTELVSRDVLTDAENSHDHVTISLKVRTSFLPSLFIC